MNKYIIIGLVAISIISCNKNGNKSDAFGNFEANEVLVSAEASGKLLQLTLEEGSILKVNDIVGIIDTTQLTLKRLQLMAQGEIINSKTDNIISQMNVQKEQLKTLQTEHLRIINLLKDQAVPTKQLDDIEGKIAIAKSQMKAIETQNRPIISEMRALQMQIAQLEDQLQKSKIINPIEGTVLEKYVEAGEVMVPGKAIYKIASIKELFLKVYVSGDQLGQIKLGQTVKVITDAGTGKLKERSGVITWISSQAEFTPKIIQTREERVNMVYAVKVKVANDGTIKIGMPGEIKL